MTLEYISVIDDVPGNYIETRVRQVSGQYDLDSLLSINNMEQEEAIGILFELGYIGLPSNDSEDTEEEEPDLFDSLED